MVTQLKKFQLVQLTNRIFYDFEYLGMKIIRLFLSSLSLNFKLSLDLSKHLAITPLTERCFLNLTNALSSLKCGTLAGGTSVGKNETISLLSQVYF